jgi:hypothetical protein
VGKKKKHGNVVKFPVRRTRSSNTAEDQTDQKLSDLIKEMALRLFKKAEAAPTRAAVEIAVLLASAAWNEALGDHGIRSSYRKLLKQFDHDNASPWSELVSTDTEQMITSLVEYKRKHFPNDRRIIMGGGLSPHDTIQIIWRDAYNIIQTPFTEQPTSPAVTRQHKEAIIAKKLVATAKKHIFGKKVVKLKDIIAGRTTAKKLQKTVVTSDRLKKLHPAHAAYVFAQNQVSVLAEQLTALDKMAPFAELISKAEDEYMPSGPPMSPLTPSFFTCWAFFDACIGDAQETIGTCILELGPTLGMDADLLHLIRLMQHSRMGLYVHEGNSGDQVTLRDFITGVTCQAIVPAGYMGHPGEFWYTRVLPPPTSAFAEHIVFQTPYLILKPGLREWNEYFRRVLPDAPRQMRLAAYEQHMKFGISPKYWTEYVFEGYVNNRADVIFLSGLPDIPESRPCSSANLYR